MKKIVGIISLLFLSFSMNAQNNFSLQNILGSKSYLIDATKNGFVLVKQNYVLRGKSDELYGKEGNSYYGENIYLGILINDHLYMNNDIEPWKQDLNFPKEIDSLKPEISKIVYRPINDTISEFISVKNITDENDKGFKTYQLKEDNSFTKSDFVEINDSLICVYLLNKDSELSQNSSFELRRDNIKEVYNIKENKFDNEKINKDIVGGAFFLPVISLGKIEYKVVAILNKEEGNWSIVSLQSNQSATKKSIGITPIK